MPDLFALFLIFFSLLFFFLFSLIRAVQQILGVGRNLDAETG
jgi:hypothetical protein